MGIKQISYLPYPKRAAAATTIFVAATALFAS